MIVRDVMNPNPATIGPDQTLADALDAMATHRVKQLVVVESGGRSIGILSDSDLARFANPAGMTRAQWQAAKVRTHMSSELYSIGSQMPLKEAAQQLLRMGVSALPVVDNGALVGILRETDFVAYMAR
ncbi:MAG: CBS domain-containing protein [Candidatus Lambdaproteobacteria bacterium]|nr:CBS domain-containing protein [Candidatus Lambdaproteobacteria bacterium]